MQQESRQIRGRTFVEISENGCRYHQLTGQGLRRSAEKVAEYFQIYEWDIIPERTRGCNLTRINQITISTNVVLVVNLTGSFQTLGLIY